MRPGYTTISHTKFRVAENIKTIIVKPKVSRIDQEKWKERFEALLRGFTDVES